MPARAASRSTASAEVEVLDVLDEPDHVAAGLAAEAVEQPARRGDVERRRLLVVERAQALEVAAAGVAQLDVLADDVVDRRLLADEGDVLVPDPPCHGVESRSRARRRPPALVHGAVRRSVGADQAGVPGDGRRVGELRDLVDDHAQPVGVRAGVRARSGPSPRSSVPGAPAAIGLDQLGEQPRAAPPAARRVPGRRIT